MLSANKPGASHFSPERELAINGLNSRRDKFCWRNSSVATLEWVKMIHFYDKYMV